MQPTEIFAKTVKAGFPARNETQPAISEENAQKDHDARDVVIADIKLLFEWAKSELNREKLVKELNS